MRKIVFLSVLVLLASTQHTIASQAEMASGRSDKPVVQAEIDGSRGFDGNGTSTQSNELDGNVTVRENLPRGRSRR